MTSKKDVLEFFDATTQAQAERHLYKYTDCGAWIAFHKWGIQIGSIVEGCDIGTAIYDLRYADKFTGADIQARIDAVEKEAEALWVWANEGPENSDETWANTGIDAPDVDTEFLHLNPSGRSA